MECAVDPQTVCTLAPMNRGAVCIEGDSSRGWFIDCFPSSAATCIFRSSAACKINVHFAHTIYPTHYMIKYSLALLRVAKFSLIFIYSVASESPG